MAFPSCLYVIKRYNAVGSQQFWSKILMRKTVALMCDASSSNDIEAPVWSAVVALYSEFWCSGIKIFIMSFVILAKNNSQNKGFKVLLLKTLNDRK